MSEEKQNVYKYADFFKQDLPVVVQHYTSNPKGFPPEDMVNKRQFWKVLYVESGSGFMKINHRRYSLGPRFVCLSHPDDLTNLVPDDKITLYNILFLQAPIADDLKKLYGDYNFFSIFNHKFSPEHSINHDLLHLLDANQKIFSLVKRMHYEYTHIDANSKEMLRFMLLELLVELARLSSRFFTKKRRSGIVGFIDKYLLEHYAEPFSSAQVAAEVGVSKGYLFSFYQKATGHTIGDTLLSIRIARAQELLKISNLTIVEICYQCGFSDLSNFYKVFKREIGCAPGEYRKTKK